MKTRMKDRIMVLMLALAMLITGPSTTVFARTADADMPDPALEPAVTEQLAEAEETAQADESDAVDADATDETAIDKQTVEASDAADAVEEAAEEAASVVDVQLTAKDWEAGLPDSVSDDVRKAMAEVAKSQLGAEAELYKAFANADSLEKGDAAFVMFVLEYAKVLGVSKAIGDDSKGTVKNGDISIPVNADTEIWIKALKDADLFTELSEEAAPQQGDVIFLKNGGKTAAAVVVDADENIITAAGAHNNIVEKFEAGADKVLGFVSLKDIAPEKFADEEQANEQSEEAAEATDAEAADEEAALTEEELAAKKAEEEAAAKAAEEEAAKKKAEKEAVSAAEEKAISKGLRRQTVNAELSAAPGVGGKLRSLGRGISGADKNTEITIIGMMPEGAYVRAYPVTVEIPGQKVLAAYDITIYVTDEDGNEVVWQPETPVNVSIRADKIADAAEKAESDAAFSIFHMENKDAAPEKVDSVDLGDGEAAFEAESFSIYVVTEEEEATKVHYRFWMSETEVGASGVTPYRTISLKDGEQMLAPADPADSTRGKFDGWKYADNDGDITFPVEVSVSGDEDTYVDIYATFDGTQYATFMSLPTGTSRTVFHTAELTPSGNTFALDLDDVPEYGGPNGYRFVGWTTERPTDAKGYGESIAKANYYKPDDTITGLIGSVTLYPVCKKMYNVAFDGNGGLVQNLPVYKVLVTGDDTWTEVLNKVTSVERSGYTKNNGWFDGPDAGAESVTFSGDVDLTADTTYYAHWNVATTKVTVKYWKEDVDKDASGNSKYYFLDEEEFTVDTESDLTVNKSSMTIGNTTLNFDNILAAHINGGNKVSGSGNYTSDSQMKYFYVEEVSAVDAEENRYFDAVHNDPYSDPPATSSGDVTFTVAEDGSTIINVWFDRAEYEISFRFLAYLYTGGCYTTDHSSLIPLIVTLDSVNRTTATYKIKLGDDLSGVWPNLTDTQYRANFLSQNLGYMPVSMGVRDTSTDSYPEAVSDEFAYTPKYVSEKLLSFADSNKKIVLWGRYNDMRFRGGLVEATVNEYYQNADTGQYSATPSRRFTYYYGKGNINDPAVPFKTPTYNGYDIDVAETTNHNGGTTRTHDNGDGTVSIEYTTTGNGAYTANVYYKPSPYTVTLNWGDKVLGTGDDILYTQQIGSYFASKADPDNSSDLNDIYTDPTAAATAQDLPDYMEFKGWYIDQEYTEEYEFHAETTMPTHTYALYAYFVPKPVTVMVDNGKNDAGNTVTNPDLNQSGSEFGNSVRHLEYVNPASPADPLYRAHEHTVAEFLPTYWSSPVWDNHTFTGWEIREKNAGGNWGAWEDLSDLNRSVDHDIELRGTWKDMSQHSIHYIEDGKEVYHDSNKYVEGCDIIVRGTDTEIYDRETETSKVFRYWLGEDETTRYYPGDIITMDNDDVILTAVFETGGSSSGSNKATYTFVVPKASGSGWDTYYEEIVYKGERLSPPPQNPVDPAYDPEDQGSTERAFQGWYKDEACKVKFEGFGTVNAPSDTTLYASFNAPYTVTYRGQSGELVSVQRYAADGQDYLDTSGVGENYSYDNQHQLIGWVAGQPVAPGTIPATYHNGLTSLQVNADMTMYPVLEGGHTLSFVTADDAAKIPDRFYASSQNLNFTWPDPDTVTRDNYTFTGKWYTDAACTQEFNWNTTLEQDTTIYAKWVLNPGAVIESEYTVVWWVERADSNGDATDPDNYYYSNAVTVNAQLGTQIGAGTTVNANGYNGAANRLEHVSEIAQADRNYFEFQKAVVSYSSGIKGNDAVTLSGNGTAPVDRSGKTALNIFVSRARYTVNFVVTGKGRITYGDDVETGTWNLPGGGWLNMPFAGKFPLLDADGVNAPKLEITDGKIYNNWVASSGDPSKTTPVILQREKLADIQGRTVTFTLTTRLTSANTYYANYRFKDPDDSEYSATDYKGKNYDQSFETFVNLKSKEFDGYTNVTPDLKEDYKDEFIGYDAYYTSGGTRHYVYVLEGTGSNAFDIYNEDGTLYNGNNTIYYTSVLTNNSGSASASNIRSGSSSTKINYPTKYTFYYVRNTRNIVIHDSEHPNTELKTIPMLTGESLEGKVDDDEETVCNTYAADGLTAPAGKEFDAWSRSDTSLVPISFTETAEVMPTNHLHIYAHWRSLTVKVTAKDGDETLQEVRKDINTKFKVFGLDIPERTGYAFVGWKNADTGQMVDEDTPVTIDITVNPVFRSLTARPLYYDLNGGSAISGMPVDGTHLISSGDNNGRYEDLDSYVVGASAQVRRLNAANVSSPRGTVDFVYWNTRPDGTGRVYYGDSDVIELSEDEDTILYAIWAPNMTTTLNYDLNFQGKPADRQVLINDYKLLDENAAKVNDNYIVGTEYDSTDREYKKFTYTNSNKTYTAGGMRPGYTMTGWDESDDADGDAAYKDGDLIRATSYRAEDGSYLETQTLYAHWQQDTFDVEAYEIIKGVEATTANTDYSDEFALPATAAVPAVYNCEATGNRFDTAYLTKIGKSAFPDSKVYAYAKIGGVKVKSIQYVAITNPQDHITGYKWQYTTDGEEWNDFVKSGANKTIVKLYYYAETIKVPVRYLNRGADGTLTEISSTVWNVPAGDDNPDASVGKNVTSYGKTAGDTREFVADIAAKTGTHKLHYVGTGIGSAGSTIALETGVTPAADYFLKNTEAGVKHANSAAGLDADNVAVKTGDFAIYVIYEEQPAYIKLSNNSLTKDFTFRLTIAGGSYMGNIRTGSGTVTASDGHYDIAVSHTSSTIVYIPYGSGLAYSVKLFKGTAEVTNLSDEAVEWQTGQGFDGTSGTLVAGPLLASNASVTLPTTYKHVAVKDVDKKSLTVSNTTVGEYADLTRTFDVTITLVKPSGGVIASSEIPEVTKPAGATEPAFSLSADEKSAVMTVSLGHNGSVTIPEIPAGWKYSISEGEHDGYDLTFSSDGGNTWEATAPSAVAMGTSDVSVQLKNEFDSDNIVPSGIAKNNSILIPLFLILALTLFIVLSMIRRRRMASGWTR